MNSEKIVSVIIPVLNEEKNVADLVDSICTQDYPRDYLEILFVDGGSTDNSKALISECCEGKDINYRIIDNPNKTAPYAFNIGITESSGDIIVIMSAHALYNADYISNGVNHLIQSGADNVGGYVKVVGRGIVGKGIAAVQSSLFGVGATDYRLSRETKYVDTVPFGTFNRSLFDKIGLYNVELPRNEDNEFNHRIIKNGGKVLLVSDMEITYFCRETIKALIENGIANGTGVGYTSIRYSDVLRLKYFVPLMFVCSLVGLPILYSLTGLEPIKWLLEGELGLYAFLDLFFSLTADTDATTKCVMPGLFPVFHISYGLGTIKGVFKGLKKVIEKD